MLFRVLLVPTLLAGLCAGQHPRKNNALAPEVRQRAEALLRSAGDPRTSHDEIWRSCCETHGTIQPLLDWLDTKLDGPDSNTTRRLLARIQRRAGHLEPALHTLEAIPAKARTNADEMTELGQMMAERLNDAKGPVTVMIPTKGFSHHIIRETQDIDGNSIGSWLQPETDQAFTDSMHKHLTHGEIKELDLHINDHEFADACVEELMKSLEP